MMNNKLLFGLIIFILLVLPMSVFAMPPAQVNVNGLEIAYAPFEYVTPNTALKLTFHVYRFSDGLSINSSAFCTLHIYNSLGSHLITLYQDNATHVYDYEFEIPDSVFNSSGLYAFNTYCECDSCSLTNTDLGGFVRAEIKVNSTGMSDSFGGWLMFVFALLLVGVTFASGLGSFLLKGVSKAEGQLYAVKGLLLLFFFINLFICGLVPLVIFNAFNDVYSLYPLIIAFFSVNTILVILFVYLYGFGLLKNTLRNFFGGGRS